MPPRITYFYPVNAPSTHAVNKDGMSALTSYSFSIKKL